MEDCANIRVLARRRLCVRAADRAACGSAGSRPSHVPNFSEPKWTSLVSQLQGSYSWALYRRNGFVEHHDALSIIWLPLLGAPALEHLASMGVCGLEPSTGLPLHAPHSTQAPMASVWRYTPPVAVPSHAWVEVVHFHRPGERTALPYFYVARGSGVSLNVGRTMVLRLPSCLDRINPARLYDGIDAASVDSVQMLDACHPADSAAWRLPTGFTPSSGLCLRGLMWQGAD